MPAKFSLNAKIYRNTGSYGAPNWVEMKNFIDVSLPLEKEEKDVSRRGSGGWEQVAAIFKKAPIEASYQRRSGTDNDYTALRNAWLNNGLIDLMVLDGDIGTAGSEGLRAEFEVLKFNRNEKLKDPITFDLAFKPGDSDNVPVWVTI